jgi:hypothetical protein
MNAANSAPARPTAPAIDPSVIAVFVLKKKEIFMTNYPS